MWLGASRWVVLLPWYETEIVSTTYAVTSRGSGPGGGLARVQVVRLAPPAPVAPGTGPLVGPSFGRSASSDIDTLTPSRTSAAAALRFAGVGATGGRQNSSSCDWLHDGNAAHALRMLRRTPSHGARYCFVHMAAASLSPTTSSFSGSHWIARPPRRSDMLPRLQMVAVRWPISRSQNGLLRDLMQLIQSRLLALNIWFSSDSPPPAAPPAPAAPPLPPVPP